MDLPPNLFRVFFRWYRRRASSSRPHGTRQTNPPSGNSHAWPVAASGDSPTISIGKKARPVPPPPPAFRRPGAAATSRTTANLHLHPDRTRRSTAPISATDPTAPATARPPPAARPAPLSHDLDTGTWITRPTIQARIPPQSRTQSAGRLRTEWAAAAGETWRALARRTRRRTSRPGNERTLHRGSCGDARRRVARNGEVVRAGIEPATHGFSVHCSTN